MREFPSSWALPCKVTPKLPASYCKFSVAEPVHLSPIVRQQVHSTANAASDTIEKFENMSRSFIEDRVCATPLNALGLAVAIATLATVLPATALGQASRSSNQDADTASANSTVDGTANSSETDSTESQEEVIRQAERSQWDSAADRRMLQKLKETFGDPKGMVRLDPVSRIWVDRKNRRIVTDGFIALTSGQLEMLACLVGTKEHESVVAVFTKAQFVHAGLLAIGAKKGTPVQWRPEYKPPTGSRIRVIALWRDEKGKKHAIDARKWVQENRTDGGHLTEDFVFAGSIFAKDPDTGREVYEAEVGDLICVANFTSATIDIPIRSLDANSLLSYRSYTERIPPHKTPVRLVLELLDKPETDSPGKTPDSSADSATGSTGKPTGSKESASVSEKPGVQNPSTNKGSATPFSLATYERLLDAPKN